MRDIERKKETLLKVREECEFTNKRKGKICEKEDQN
jgi:hypothetical protein